MRKKVADTKQIKAKKINEVGIFEKYIHTYIFDDRQFFPHLIFLHVNTNPQFFPPIVQILVSFAARSLHFTNRNESDNKKSNTETDAIGSKSQYEIM